MNYRRSVFEEPPKNKVCNGFSIINFKTLFKEDQCSLTRIRRFIREIAASHGELTECLVVVISPPITVEDLVDLPGFVRSENYSESFIKNDVYFSGEVGACENCRFVIEKTAPEDKSVHELFRSFGYDVGGEELK